MTEERSFWEAVKDLEALLTGTQKKLDALKGKQGGLKIKIDEKEVRRILFEKVLPYKIDKYKKLGELDRHCPEPLSGHKVPLPIHSLEGHTNIKEIISFTYDGNQYPRRDSYANIQWVYHAFFIRCPGGGWKEIYHDFANRPSPGTDSTLFELEPYGVRDQYMKKAISIFKKEKKAKMEKSIKNLENKIKTLREKYSL